MQSLEAVDLDTLERLCERGEMLLHPACTFFPLIHLIVAGFAVRAEQWHAGIEIVRPTELGFQVARIRADLRTRIEKAPKPRVDYRGFHWRNSSDVRG